MRALALLSLLAWVQPKEMESVNARKNFWSFRPVVRPDALNIDALAPAGPAISKQNLIRRATLDLTGLPPAPAEVKAFLADNSPDAYEKLVDRLMASPRYGERWAQRWLDVVRYADTNGFELDADRTHAWRYRDYVIRSFNENKRFDRFIQEQIAGDELWPKDPDATIATGFLRAGPQHIVGGNQDVEQNRQELLIEMTAVVGNGVLGLTMNCARCHNHKFDPILQADYYRLQAVFAGTLDKDIDLANAGEKAAYSLNRVDYEARLKPIEEAIAKIEKPYREKLREQKKQMLPAELKAVLDIPKAQRNDQQKAQARDAESQSSSSWDEVLATLTPEDREARAKLRLQLHAIELDEPQPPLTAYAVADAETAPETHILKIGDHKMKLGVVQPGVPLVLALAKGDSSQGDVATAVTGRRAELAKWITTPDHPLTARVFVNRMWQFRVGTGIVATPNDFGTLGSRPANPKLLDWLAGEFVSSGWDVKRLDRMILTSAAYKQAGTRRRLEGEMIRDAVLSVSGQMNLKMYGPPVRTPIEKEIYDIIFTEQEPDNLWPLPKDLTEMSRRSIYVLNKRTVRLPLLANFDQPDTMTSCPQRPVSTHALQALSMLNSDFMADAAQKFASRLGKKDPIGDAYWLALTREPKPEERTMAKEFLTKGGKLDEFCLALLNRNEFVYLP